MRYPTAEVYEQLYARFLLRSPGELFGDVDLREKRVIDLCGGGGRLSMYAHAAGARVTYVDREHDMIPEAWLRENRVSCYALPVDQFLKSAVIWDRHLERQDYIMCQQGVNYWLFEGDEMIQLAWERLKPGGSFIFNTFNRDPGELPKVRTYQLNGHEFSEVTYRIGDLVHHVQARDGLEPHVTAFRWISPEEFREALSMFTVTEAVDGTTTIWRCRKCSR